MRVEADWQAIAVEEMRFFGNVSAAISHEINNRIAIINEKAGLLEDLAAMMAQGKEVDPQRFEVQSRKIVEQIKLARKNVQDLNRFAHSAEKQTATIDCGRTSRVCCRAVSREKRRQLKRCSWFQTRANP